MRQKITVITSNIMHISIFSRYQTKPTGLQQLRITLVYSKLLLYCFLLSVLFINQNFTITPADCSNNNKHYQSAV